MAAFKDNDHHHAEAALDAASPDDATSVLQASDEEFIYVKARQLRPSALNVRRHRVPNAVKDAETKASIKAYGILQNLVVHELKSRGKVPLYGVAAGGRRHRFIDELIAEGHFTKDTEFLCRLARTPAEAIAMSLAENNGREDMTIADTIAAFADMVAEGASVDDISLYFGVSPLTVERRIKLASVSPALLDLFRAGSITTDQLEALALTDDHETQVRVWKTTPQYERQPRTLRALVLGTNIDARSSSMLKFVTMAAYEADGGTVVRDLFDDDENAGYIADPERLQRLALAKLEPKLAKLRAEGWGWVEPMFTFGHSEQQKFSDAPMGCREPTAAEAAAIEAAARERAEAEAALETLTQDENCDEEEAERLEGVIDAASTKQRKLAAKLEVLPPEVKALAGAVVTIDHNGKVVTHRARVKPEHRKSAAKAASATRGEEAATDDAANAPDAPTISEALCRKLTANRTIALQVVLSDNHHVALAALAHPLVRELLVQGYARSPSALDLRATGCEHHMASNADDVQSSRAWAVMADRLTTWRARLPADVAQLLRWLIEQSDETLVELLSLCAALSLNTIQSREGANPCDQLATAVGLDMADWWEATSASYLSQVPKARAAAAVAEALTPEACAGFDKMKKGEAVAQAEALLSGRRWLPTVLRTRPA